MTKADFTTLSWG